MKPNTFNPGQRFRHKPSGLTGIVVRRNGDSMLGVVFDDSTTVEGLMESTMEYEDCFDSYILQMIQNELGDDPHSAPYREICLTVDAWQRIANLIENAAP